MAASTAVTYRPHERGSADQKSNRSALLDLYRDTPIPAEQLLINFGLYTRSGPVAKLLFLNELYEQIVRVPGDIIEFGTWWGQSLVTFLNLRAIYEPYAPRKVIGFDTFTGYPQIGPNDVDSETIKVGGYAVSGDYEAHLTQLLEYHERENVLAHIKKFELVRGDICETVAKYYADHPAALVSLAFFDLALYEPTKAALEAIRPRMVKGSIIAFDELTDEEYPGETLAARDVLGGFAGARLVRSKYLPSRAYMVVD